MEAMNTLDFDSIYLRIRMCRRIARGRNASLAEYYVIINSVSEMVTVVITTTTTESVIYKVALEYPSLFLHTQSNDFHSFLFFFTNDPIYP